MQISRFLRKGADGYLFYCPACEGAHKFRVGGDGTRPQWTFSGDAERPSFAPSLLHYNGHRSWTEADGPPRRLIELPADKRIVICHLFVKTGEELVASKRKLDADPGISYIDYCGDNPHKMNGQVVPLPELPGFMRGDVYGDGNP